MPFHVVAETESGTISCILVDFNLNGLSIRVPLEKAGSIATSTHSLEVLIGDKRIGYLASPTLLRQEGDVFVFQPNRIVPKSAAVRSASRLQLRKDFLASAMAPSPFDRAENIFFSIADVHAEGCQLKTSLSNKGLLAGLVLKGTQILLPAVGVTACDLLVVSTLIEKESVIVRARFVNCTGECLGLLAQFAMIAMEAQPPEASAFLKVIRSGGFSTKVLSKATRIQRCDNPSTYWDVLAVRHTAFYAAGKIDALSTVESMADEHDQSALILSATISGRVVGTIRLSIVKDDKHLFPFEQYLQWPETLDYGRDDVLEMSRLAILPGFQGTDLLQRLFRAAAKEALSRKKVVVCMATKKVRPLYLKLGGTVVSEEIPHPVVKNESLALVVIDAKKFATGKGMSGIAWEKIASLVLNELSYYSVSPPAGFNLSRFILARVESGIVKKRNVKVAGQS